MSRLTGDRNSQQQNNQNQQIVQPIHNQQQALHTARNPTATPQQQQQQQVVALPPSGSFIIINSNINSLNANDGLLRTPSNVVNTIQNSICYSTPPAQSSVSQQNLLSNAPSVGLQSTPISHLDPTSPIAKKRLKLEIADSSSSCGSNTTTEDLAAIKSRTLKHKLLRFEGLKLK